MVFRISFSMHVSESQFNRYCPIVLRRSLFVSFSLETERPSMQFVTFMHIKKPPSSISTLGNTDFKGESHNCHQKPCNACGLRYVHAFIEKVTLIEVLVIHISQI